MCIGLVVDIWLVVLAILKAWAQFRDGVTARSQLPNLMNLLVRDKYATLSPASL